MKYKIIPQQFEFRDLFFILFSPFLSQLCITFFVLFLFTGGSFTFTYHKLHVTATISALFDQRLIWLLNKSYWSF